MGQIITIIIAIATTVTSGMLLFFLQAKIKENKELRKQKEQAEQIREDAVANGVRQLLSVRMEEMYDVYADKGEVPLRIYRRWMKMYKSYKELGGNGTFERMNQEMEEKHIKRKEC